jgi:hypothetical protein
MLECNNKTKGFTLGMQQTQTFGFVISRFVFVFQIYIWFGIGFEFGIQYLDRAWI